MREKQAKSKLCDQIAVRIGTSPTGRQDVLLFLSYRGKSLLSGPIALRPEQARMLAAELSAKAESCARGKAN